MRVAEIFQSVQGEGRLAGTPSVFLRLTGCNLRCWYCDTPYASWTPQGVFVSTESLVERLSAFNCEHLVITGGEPMLQPELVPLTRQLAARSRHITIETAGTVDRSVRADLMSISPKLSNSTPKSGRWSERHERLRNRRDVVANLIRRYGYQLKFVVDTEQDLDEIQGYLHGLPEVPPDHVWLMPQSVSRAQLALKIDWVADAARRLGCRVSPRLQNERFGNRRGT